MKDGDTKDPGARESPGTTPVVNSSLTSRNNIQSLDGLQNW